jgi:hypothetical protein
MCYRSLNLLSVKVGCLGGPTKRVGSRSENITFSVLEDKSPREGGTTD